MVSSLTEIALFSLQPNASVKDGVEEIISIGTKAPGFLVGWWGQPVETPQNLQMIIEWATYQDHENFSKSGAGFERCLEILAGITSGPPDAKHIAFDTAVFASAPVVDLTTFISLSTTFEKEAQTFYGALAKAPGCTGVTHGHVREEIAFGEGTDKAYGAASGWVSIEAQRKALESAELAQGWEWLKGRAGSTESHHVKPIPF